MSPPLHPHVYTIAPGVAFIDALAQGLIERCDGDTLALARMQVLLPNRRSVRALTEAFVRRSQGGLLLPRLTPIADLDQDEALGSLFASVEAELAAGDVLPPAIDPIRRRLLLAQMVRRWRAARGDRINAVEGLRLADQLAAAFDAIGREGLDPAAITRCVPADLAEHWLQTLDFFKLMLEIWPGLLAAEGACDAVIRHNHLVERLAARWQAAPPAQAIVAAGMTAATPAQAALLAVVARLPAGMLVLPGLDTTMSAAEWEAIACAERPVSASAAGSPPPRDTEVHPQFGLKQLLQRIAVPRDAVAPWPTQSACPTPPGRIAAVARAMSPAAFTADWRRFAVAPEWFDNVRSIEAPDQNTEAQVIALALRHSLETPGATAALVTPDRNLARRVVAHCARWGIDIDDSAGQQLGTTPPGALALALVEAAARHFAPVALLAVLKHPLVNPDAAASDVSAPDARLAWLARVRQLDIALRGVRPAPGLDGVAGLLDELDHAAKDPGRPQLGPWWAQLAPRLAPLEALFSQAQLALPALIEALVAALDALAPAAIWRGPAGRKLGELLGALDAHGAALAAFEPLDAPALIGTFLSEAAVRP
ncbi:MAG: double-strand break repair protein AddB, partial [Polymorphobacter sp.]